MVLCQYKNDDIGIWWLLVGFAPYLKYQVCCCIHLLVFIVRYLRLLSAVKRGKTKLASGWQKRVAHTHSDVEAQAALMCRRGLKHKEVGAVSLVPATWYTGW